MHVGITVPWGFHVNLLVNELYANFAYVRRVFDKTMLWL